MYHLRQLKDTKGVIRGRNSKKDEKYNGQKKKEKTTNNNGHREQKIEQR
jgi:hypothetical protein